MFKLLTTALFICIWFIGYSQQLQVVDELKSRLGAVPKVIVSQEGNRHYLLRQASDSIVINGHKTIVAKRDSIFDQPYASGRSFLAIVDSRFDTASVVWPAGEVFLKTDTSIITFHTMIADSIRFINDLILKDTLDENQLVMFEYDLLGNPLRHKEWKLSGDRGIFVEKLINKNGHLLISGWAGGGFDTLKFEQIPLRRGGGGAQHVIMEIDSNLNAYDLIDIEGKEYEFAGDITLNNQYNLFISGTSSSYYVTNNKCIGDTLYEFSDTWRSSMIYMYHFDENNQCIASKTQEYDFDGGLNTDSDVLSDDSYILSGLYLSSYMQFDDVRIENPDYSYQGFIYKFSPQFEAVAAFQLQGEIRPNRISNIHVDDEDNIWFCGHTRADSIEIGPITLYDEGDFDTWGFVAKLDGDLSVVSAFSIGEHFPYEMFGGPNNEVFLLSRLSQNNFFLHKIVDSVSSINESKWIEPEVLLYPNPTDGKFYVDIRGDQYFSKYVEVYDMQGRMVQPRARVHDGSPITFNLQSGVYFIRIYLDNKETIIRKLVVQ